MAQRKNRQSYYAGKRFGKKIFAENVELFGELGVRKSDKAHNTCRKYSTDYTIKKTKSGKALTPNKRSFYSGMADGLYEMYNRTNK